MTRNERWIYRFNLSLVDTIYYICICMFVYKSDGNENGNGIDRDREWLVIMFSGWNSRNYKLHINEVTEPGNKHWHWHWSYMMTWHGTSFLWFLICNSNLTPSTIGDQLNPFIQSLLLLSNSINRNEMDGVK